MKGAEMAKQKLGEQTGITGVTVAVIAAVCLFVGFFAGWTIQGMNGPAGSAVQAMQGGQEGQDMAPQIATAEAETRAHPEDASTWVHLGNLYFDTDQPEKSVTAYEKALALRPGDPNVLVDQGVMFRRLQEFDQALVCFDKAIKADPGHVIAHFNKSIVLLHDKNDRAGAIAALETLAAKNPTAQVPGGQSVAGLLLELKQGGQEGQNGQESGPNFLK
jgi:cytochrome c-type biogenesis protein CcmH/NrfG